MPNELMHAAGSAVAAGQMTQAQHDELGKVAAIDWRMILGLLPLIATFFPALAPLLPFITPIMTFVLNLINGGTNVVPVPTPFPVPIPDGGGNDPPVPH